MRTLSTPSGVSLNSPQSYFSLAFSHGFHSTGSSFLALNSGALGSPYVLFHSSRDCSLAVCTVCSPAVCTAGSSDAMASTASPQDLPLPHALPIIGSEMRWLLVTLCSGCVGTSTGFSGTHAIKFSEHRASYLKVLMNSSSIIGSTAMSASQLSVIFTLSRSVKHPDSASTRLVNAFLSSSMRCWISSAMTADTHTTFLSPATDSSFALIASYTWASDIPVSFANWVVALSPSTAL